MAHVPMRQAAKFTKAEALHEQLQAPSNDAPELAFERALRLENPRDCAAACAHLLASLDELAKNHPKLSLKLRYRLELMPWKNNAGETVEGDWRLRLKLDSVAWFDWLRLQTGGDVEATKIARNVVDAWRDERRRRPTVDPPTESPISVLDYCFRSNCSCKNRHPSIAKSCPVQVMRQDGPRLCWWCVADELVVQAGSTVSNNLSEAASKFGLCLTSRKEQLRELLLCPLSHMVNTDFVSYVETWQCIADVSSILSDVTPNNHALQGIAVNFGTWETANTQDKSDVKYAVDSHAHIHLQLSRRTVDILSKEAGCNCLIGRVYDPEDHMQADARDLETGRVLSLTQKNLEKKVDDMNAKLDILLKAMEKLTKV